MGEEEKEIESSGRQFYPEIEETMPMEWNYSPEWMQNLKTVGSMMGAKHGLATNVPILCRKEKCPYAKACWALAQGLAPQEGERCPVEAVKVMQKFQLYTSEFPDVNNTDLGLIKELVDIEIQLERASTRMAIDGDFIQEVTIGITEGGEEIKQPQLHKATEYQDKLLKKKFEILQLLHLTRKDKAGDKLTINMDPSTYTAQLLKKAQELRAANVIDAEYKEADE